MNIISNCCATGYLYKNILKEQFPNMFIWSAMLPKDVILLIKHYDKLNFENIKIEESFIHKRPERNFKIVIDNLVSVHYTHYILSEDKSTKIEGYNVYSSNIKEFTIEKYKNRLKRETFTEVPVFLILDNKKDLSFSNEEIGELLSCTEKKIILFTDKKIVKSPDNFLYFNESGYDHEGCMNRHYKEILCFIKEG